MNCISYELARNGDFFDYIKVSGSLPRPIVQVYVQQLIKAISSMHQAGVCHRDLKLENLMLDDNYNLKIIDFGLARRFEPMKKLQILFGTPEFVAPEVVNFEPIGYSTDMWALGVITYVL